MKKMFFNLNMRMLLLLILLNFTVANFMEESSDGAEQTDEITTDQAADNSDEVEDAAQEPAEEDDDQIDAEKEAETEEASAEAIEPDAAAEAEKIEQARKEALDKAIQTKNALASVILNSAKDAREIEFRQRIDKTGKVAILLTLYLSMKFWQFSNRVVNKIYAPAANALYDDSGLGLEDTLLEAYAIAVRALIMSSAATQAFKKTSEGKEIYDEIVLEAYQDLQQKSKDYQNALLTWQKSSTNANYNAFRQALLDKNASEIALSAATKKYRKAAINFKYGKPAASIADFLKMQGSRLAKRTKYYKNIAPQLEQIAASLGMTAEQMLTVMAEGGAIAAAVAVNPSTVQQKIDAAKAKFGKKLEDEKQKFNVLKEVAKKIAVKEVTKKVEKVKAIAGAEVQAGIDVALSGLTDALAVGQEGQDQVVSTAEQTQAEAEAITATGEQQAASTEAQVTDTVEQAQSEAEATAAAGEQQATSTVDQVKGEASKTKGKISTSVNKVVQSGTAVKKVVEKVGGTAVTSAAKDIAKKTLTEAISQNQEVQEEVDEEPPVE